MLKQFWQKLKLYQLYFLIKVEIKGHNWQESLNYKMLSHNYEIKNEVNLINHNYNGPPWKWDDASQRDGVYPKSNLLNYDSQNYDTKS